MPTENRQSTCDHEIGGETLKLLGEGAIFLKSESTLMIADVHLGKAASFRSAAIPIPSGTTSNTLYRLSQCLNKANASHLVILGDFWHSKEGKTKSTIDEVSQWRASHKNLKITLVKGNHDVRSGKLPVVWDVNEVNEPFLLGKFSLAHFQERCDPELYGLAGHIHPGVRMEGSGRQSKAFKCFWFGKSFGILPAFGDFTGLTPVRPFEGDAVFAIHEGEIFPIHKSLNEKIF